LFAGLALVPVFTARRMQLPANKHPHAGGSFREGLKSALRALLHGEVLRWLTLLELGDLLMDVLLGFLALYLVDIAGAAQGEASIAVIVWTGMGLVGGLLIIPLLERVRGLFYLRISAICAMILFVLFLLLPGLGIKTLLLGALGLSSSGWYSILKAQLYSAMPGQSGSVMTVGNVYGLVGGLVPLALGLVAEQFGLQTTMWLLLLGPVALLVGLPRTGRATSNSQQAI